MRWWMHVVTRLPCVYVHEVLRSDDDRALHDHPWANLSVILAGGYLEHTIRAGGVHVRTERTAGDIVFRRAKAAHRLEMIPDMLCYTLFITGFRVRTWGFHCPLGWVPWRLFVARTDRGSVGAGCEALTQGEDA